MWTRRIERRQKARGFPPWSLSLLTQPHLNDSKLIWTNSSVSKYLTTCEALDQPRLCKVYDFVPGLVASAPGVTTHICSGWGFFGFEYWITLWLRLLQSEFFDRKSLLPSITVNFGLAACRRKVVNADKGKSYQRVFLWSLAEVNVWVSSWPSLDPRTLWPDIENLDPMVFSSILKNRARLTTTVDGVFLSNWDKSRSHNGPEVR